MQRQSLGSPGSKHHHPGTPSDSDDDKKKRKSRGSLASPPEHPYPLHHDDDDEEEKPIRSSTCIAQSERSIHLIPVLTLLCFLILYLFSHHPSPKDLAGFGIHERMLDSQETEMARFIGAEAAMRSNRRLKEVEKLRWRKLGGGRRR